MKNFFYRLLNRIFSKLVTLRTIPFIYTNCKDDSWRTRSLSMVVPDSNTCFQPRKQSESNLNGSTTNSQLELADLEYLSACVNTLSRFPICFRVCENMSCHCIPNNFRFEISKPKIWFSRNIFIAIFFTFAIRWIIYRKICIQMLNAII